VFSRDDTGAAIHGNQLARFQATSRIYRAHHSWDAVLARHLGYVWPDASRRRLWLVPPDSQAARVEAAYVDLSRPASETLTI